MPWTVYGILIIFGMFVLLMVFNPKLSCFGKRISSPLYPLLRKKRLKNRETEDYGFSLIDNDSTTTENGSTSTGKGNRTEPGESVSKKGKKSLKTFDYGFHLGDSKPEEKNQTGLRIKKEGS